ncbi:hypothetical protein JCM9279_001320 [Rhodotorula babjevae]
MSGLLSNGLVQTAALIASPYLVPRAVRLAQDWLNPRPKGERAPAHPASRPAPPPRRRRPDSSRLAAFRLFVVTLGVSLAVFSALSPPHNLFLSLSTPHSTLSTLFPLLRRPLDLRLSTDTLARLWTASLAGRRPLNDDELLLASRLQTLDARLAYIAYGAGPLTQCAWCRLSSSGGSGSAAGLLGTDYLLSVVPGVSVAYLTALAGSGLLLAGNGRERWRVWAVVAVLGAAGYELWMRLTWDGARGGVGGSVTMLHSKLHLLRTLFSALLLLASFLAPAASIPPIQPTTAALVAPAVASLAAQNEAVLHRLRALSMQRMAVLHDDDMRDKVTAFWSSASHESALARADPAVRRIIEAQLRAGGDASPSAAFKVWVEGVMRPPGAPGTAGLDVQEGREEDEGDEERDEREKEGDDEADESPLSA